MAWLGNPLPAGWEARWDAGQSRYFFIDHTTKKTTWVDPRTPANAGYYSHQPQNASTSFPMQSRQAKLCENCNEPVNKPGEDLCTKCLLSTLEEETSFYINDALLRKLTADYPQAREDEVNDAIQSSNNQEFSAKRILERKGYVTVDSIVNKIRIHYSQCDLDIIKTTVESCKCDESATRRRLKQMGFLTQEEEQEEVKRKKEEAEKKQREEEQRKATVEAAIRKDYKHLDSNVVNNALEAGAYKDFLVRAILTNVEKQQKEKEKREQMAKAHSAQSTPERESAGPSSTRGKSPAKSLQSGSSVESLPGKKSSTKESAGKQTISTKKMMDQQKPSATSQKQKVMKPKAQPVKQVTSPIKPSKPSRAQGPDPSLPKGPQDDLLIKSYITANGSDSNLVKGPSCQVYGSQGAVGPDPSLVIGPQFNYRREEVYI